MPDCAVPTNHTFPVVRSALVISAVLLLGACGSSGSSGTSSSTGTSGSTGSAPLPPNTVRVAVEGPMTGPQSATGIDMWRGAQLMANQVNAAGGVLGKHLDLVQVDDRADANTGVAAARRAISQHVSAVIGPYNSSVGIANLPVYLRAGVVVVRLTSNSKTNNMGITLQPMDYQVAPVEASAVEKTPGIRSIAIVYDTSAYTSGVAAQMKSLLTGAGISVVAYESVTSDQTSFSDTLARVKAAAPQLVYYSAYDPQAEDLVQQAGSLQVPGVCLVDGLAAQGPTFLKTVSPDLAAKCIFSGVPTADQLPGAAPYESAYRAAYHDDPGTWGSFAYDSLGLLVQQVGAVHSWSPAVLNPALLHVTGYAGITGTVTIDPATGNRNDPPIIMQIVNSTGRYVVAPTWTSTGALPTS